MDDLKKKRSFYTDEELPKVSVIIPAFNEENTIGLTLDSILKSEYPKSKLDIFVVDDGSTDNTYKIAKRYEIKGIRVFKMPKNSGKGAALNFGIPKAKGEIIFTMDADTTVRFDSLKKMVRYFKDPEVMSVTPGMITRNPKNVIQRIQYMEYLTGIFLRKTFAALNAVHITPGAFSAYRKEFFDKYGGYDENNITEDLEVALRIQFHKYKIENAPDAPAYTNPPAKFSHLLKQRRRWYVGLMRNIWSYRKLFGKEYGDLGVFVLPVAWIGIVFSVTIFIYFFIKTIGDIIEEIFFYKSINFDFGNIFDLNYYFFERLIFKLVTNNILVFLCIFVFIVGLYLYYTVKKTGRISGLFINLPLFFMFFAILFGFWWIVSIFYVLFNRDVSWK